jgi:hypothetical protein
MHACIIFLLKVYFKLILCSSSKNKTHNSYQHKLYIRKKIKEENKENNYYLLILDNQIKN